MRKLLVTACFLCITTFIMAQSKATTHQVEKGETLYAIAKKYHVSVEALEKANSSLGANFKLKIGQKLNIPASAKSAETKAEKPVNTSSKAAKPETVTAKQPTKPEPAATQPTASGQQIHVVAKGETVYAIAKANGLTWKQIKDANHLSDDMKLKLGQKLIIPSKNPEAMYNAATKEEKPESKPVVKSEPARSTEQGKDYLSSEPPVIKKEQPIAPKPVEQPKPEEVKPAESKPTEVKADTKPVESKPAEVKPEPRPVEKPAPVKAKTPEDGDENPFAPRPAANTNVNPSDYPAVFSSYVSSGKKKVYYRGLCTFMQSDNPGNQYLALYNYADMGSILKVTNLMSKETIYVKVIGKVPAADGQRDVILKVSAEAASKLKVSEDKFLVEVTGYNN